MALGGQEKEVRWTRPRKEERVPRATRRPGMTSAGRELRSWAPGFQPQEVPGSRDRSYKRPPRWGEQRGCQPSPCFVGSPPPRDSDEEVECFAIPAGPGQNQTEFKKPGR